jgi:hypothetical protein
VQKYLCCWLKNLTQKFLLWHSFRVPDILNFFHIIFVVLKGWSFRGLRLFIDIFLRCWNTAVSSTFIFMVEWVNSLFIFISDLCFQGPLYTQNFNRCDLTVYLSGYWSKTCRLSAHSLSGQWYVMCTLYFAATDLSKLYLSMVFGIYNHTTAVRSRELSVGIVTRIQARQSGDQNLTRAKRFLFSTKSPERLWGPVSFHFSG